MRASGALLIGLAVAALLSGCKPPDTTVKDTRIAVVSETIGVGPPAKVNDLVTINYRIVTDEGREILSQEEYRFIVGTGSVIEGIDDAVVGMRVSGERVIRCPPHRHWGRAGYGDGQVPANAMLTVHLELQWID